MLAFAIGNSLIKQNYKILEVRLKNRLVRLGDSLQISFKLETSCIQEYPSMPGCQ